MEVQEPCDETNLTSCDASQAINTKAEEEAGPVLISFPTIKAGPEGTLTDLQEEYQLLQPL
jgi:hypothetical protein